MSKDEYRYREVYALAADVSSSIMDMEGGDMVLISASELLQEFLETGNVPAAEAVAKKLCEISLTQYKETEDISAEEKAIWLDLFWEVLCEEFDDGD